LGIAAGAVAVLGLAQLLLPGLAAQRVRDQLGRYGTVRSVSVSAFPAIELLWGNAQSATVSAGNLDMSPAQASELLWKARGVQRVDMRAASMRVGTLTLRDVSWRKRGQELTTRGSVAEADLLAAIPGSTGFQLLGSTAGGVEMRVSGSLFGVAGSVEVLLSAKEGEVVAQPQGIPFAGFVKITLLSAPHMYIQSFGLTGSTSASAAAGDPSYLVSINARLR
jgi:LmeA-like phospholipid-binding